MKNATPKPQKTIFICKNNMEALHIKNAIQRVSSIYVGIEKNNGIIEVTVRNENFSKAEKILTHIKPVFSEPKQYVEETVVEESNTPMWVELLHNIEGFIYSMLPQNKYKSQLY